MWIAVVIWCADFDATDYCKSTVIPKYHASKQECMSHRQTAFRGITAGTEAADGSIRYFRYECQDTRVAQDV